MAPQYADEGFLPGSILGDDTLPPVEIFPALFDADTAALALDLGDLSGRSLTLMGMSTALTNQVNTASAIGCDTMSGMPPGADMDGKDVVLALRFDSPVMDFEVFANNTHWPGANVALFDDALLDPLTALACDGGTVGDGFWGKLTGFPIATAQQYYLVADGIIPAADPGLMPEGAFSISIVHSGDPSQQPRLAHVGRAGRLDGGRGRASLEQHSGGQRRDSERRDEHEQRWRGGRSGDRARYGRAD